MNGEGDVAVVIIVVWGFEKLFLGVGRVWVWIWRGV